MPGSLARLGTRAPGSGKDFDIHQPAFDIDERAIGMGLKLLSAAALAAVHGSAAAPEAPPTPRTPGVGSPGRGRRGPRVRAQLAGALS